MKSRLSKLIVFLLLLTLTLTACGKSSDTVSKIVIGSEVSDQSDTESTQRKSIKKDSPLTGDWYGWWRMSETSGDWKDMYGYWWDCCMHISEDSSFIIWDEDMPRAEPMSEGELKIDATTYSCFGGYFLDKELNNKSWSIVLSEDGFGKFLTISGKYKALNGGFNYEFYLRPWGSLWPEDDEDALPYYYYDWYLPKVNSNADMPEIIGKNNSESSNEEVR